MTDADVRKGELRIKVIPILIRKRTSEANKRDEVVEWMFPAEKQFFWFFQIVELSAIDHSLKIEEKVIRLFFISMENCKMIYQFFIKRSLKTLNFPWDFCWRRKFGLWPKSQYFTDACNNFKMDSKMQF